MDFVDLFDDYSINFYQMICYIIYLRHRRTRSLPGKEQYTLERFLSSI